MTDQPKKKRGRPRKTKVGHDFKQFKRPKEIDKTKKLLGTTNINELADLFMSQFDEDEIVKELDRVDFSKYKGKPKKFCEEQLDMFVTDDMAALMESVVNNKVTVAISANATGKTHASAALALWWYRAYKGSQVLTLAAPPERNLRENLWSLIRGFCRQNKEIVDGHKVTTLKIVPDGINSDEDSDKLPMVIGLTIPSAGDAETQATRVSGFHSPAQLAILDEADGIPDGVFKGLDGVLSGDNSRLVCLFNPKMKSGPVYRMIRDGLANIVHLTAFNHPNVISGDDIIPGAVSRNKTIERINNWTSPVRAGEEPNETNCFEIPEFLVGKTAESGAGKKYPPLPGGWRKIDEPAFSYIVLGQYPPQGSNQLISQEWINAARSRWDLFTASNNGKPPTDVRPLLGMDVADEGVDWNTIVASYGNYIAPLEKWRGMDVDLSSTKASEHYSNLHAYQINVESDGLGASVAPKMGRQGYWLCPKCSETFFNDNIHVCPNCKHENGHNVEMDRIHINARKVSVGAKSSKKCELGQFGCLRDELWWRTREWLSSDQAMLPPDKDLIEELLVATYGVVNGEIKVMNSKIIREKLGRSADSASALIQTRHTGSGRPRVTNLL